MAAVPIGKDGPMLSVATGHPLQAQSKVTIEFKRENGNRY
jgi:hypothetical protein